MTLVLIPHTSDLDGRVGFIVRSDRTNARVDDVGWFDDWDEAREEAAALYPDAIELDGHGHEVDLVARSESLVEQAEALVEEEAARARMGAPANVAAARAALALAQMVRLRALGGAA